MDYRVERMKRKFEDGLKLRGLFFKNDRERRLSFGYDKSSLNNRMMTYKLAGTDPLSIQGGTPFYSSFLLEYTIYVSKRPDAEDELYKLSQQVQDLVDDIFVIRELNGSDIEYNQEN